MGDLYIGAYWGPRREPVEQCTERLANCLKDLAAASDVFAAWYEKGRSKHSAKKHAIEPTHDALLGILNAGRNKRDIDETMIDELGFRVGLWNGESEGRAASLSVTCGLYAQSEHLRNAVVLSFPESLGKLAEKEPALTALLAVVRAWEPEWAGIISMASMDTRPFTPASLFVDWMIYLRQFDINLNQLPPSASVVKVDTQGTIVITQDSPVDAGDQSHLQNVMSVEAAISV